MRFRKPRIGIGKKGIKIKNIGVRLGGKRSGINLSRKGVSASAGIGGTSYNTRRGLSFGLGGGRPKARKKGCCALPFFGGVTALIGLVVSLWLYMM